MFFKHCNWGLSALASAGLLTAAVNATAADGAIDFNTGEGYLQAQRKIHCSLRDNEPVTYVWKGRAYARVPGVRDRMLFQVLGMNVRQCVSVATVRKAKATA